MAMEKVEITGLFPRRLRQILESISLDFDQVEEVRLRWGQPVLLRVNGSGAGGTVMEKRRLEKTGKYK